MRHMARYDVSRNKYFKRPASRGTDTSIKGTFYYGAHLVQYKYSGLAPGLITYEVVDFSERRVQQKNNVIAGITAGVVIIAVIAASGGTLAGVAAAASTLFPRFVLLR